MRLLLVEDDPNLSRSLAAQLEQAGYSVEKSTDGREGLYYAREYPVDLAIVDLGLPSMSGVELIKQLRADGKEYPILVLTARDRWQDKVEALKLGADDYVVKPFNVEELLARVDALLRRAGGWAQSELVCGPITLDTRTQEVKVNGAKLELTSFEYKLLEYLMLHAGEVLSKTQITEALYSEDFERDSNVIEVFIGRLRRKLDPENSVQAHRNAARPRLPLGRRARRTGRRLIVAIASMALVRSLRARVVLWVSVALVVLFAATGVVLDIAFRNSTDQARRELLEVQVLGLDRARRATRAAS